MLSSTFRTEVVCWLVLVSEGDGYGYSWRRFASCALHAMRCHRPGLFRICRLYACNIILSTPMHYTLRTMHHAPVGNCTNCRLHAPFDTTLAYNPRIHLWYHHACQHLCINACSTLHCMRHLFQHQYSRSLPSQGYMSQSRPLLSSYSLTRMVPAIHDHA